MSKKLRLLFAFLLLAVSLTLLAWALWPAAIESRVVPVSPADLQLPEAGAFLFYWMI